MECALQPFRRGLRCWLCDRRKVGFARDGTDKTVAGHWANLPSGTSTLRADLGCGTHVEVGKPDLPDSMESLVAVCNLGSRAAVHLAINFFRETRVDVQEPARRALHHRPLHDRTHTQFTAHRSFVFRWADFLRIIPSLEKFVSDRDHSRSAWSNDCV